MIRKQDRTVDKYKRAGAKMRIFKHLGTKLLVDISTVLTAPEKDKLTRALGKIDEVCSRAEDNMFHDHPNLSNDYLSVFYGSVNSTPRNAVDAEMIAMAKEAADDLFR